MSWYALKDIEATEALELLRRGQPLEELHVKGQLDLWSLAAGSGWVEVPVKLASCIIDDYSSPLLDYLAPVEWISCTFRNADFYAVHFTKGLVCRDTQFNSEILWGPGGVSLGTPLRLERVTFEKFVDFWDCHFRGPVILKDVAFLDGTNLLNDDYGCVLFDVNPEIMDVSGALDVGSNLQREGGRWIRTYENPHGPHHKKPSSSVK